MSEANRQVRGPAVRAGDGAMRRRAVRCHASADAEAGARRAGWGATAKQRPCTTKPKSPAGPSRRNGTGRKGMRAAGAGLMWRNGPAAKPISRVGVKPGRLHVALAKPREPAEGATATEAEPRMELRMPCRREPSGPPRRCAALRARRAWDVRAHAIALGVKRC